MIPIIVKPNILTNNKIKKLNKEQRRNAIRGYAESQAKLVKNKKKCSCHAMVDIWDYAKQFYTHWFNNDEESYVEDVAYILAGVNEWATGTDSTQVRGFDDSGFKSKFQDVSNQVQHFSGGVAAGFQYGYYAYHFHRQLRPDTPEDTALNDVSTKFGAGLNGIGVSLSEVKAYIENNACRKDCGICNNGKGR